MPTYLYCLRSDRREPPEGLTGVDGSPVRAIEAMDLVAWVSDVAERVGPTVDRLKAHDAVCTAALDAGETPLPVRFGQTFANDAAAISGLASRAATLRARLARISGCVELRVAITRGSDGGMNAGKRGEGEPEAVQRGSPSLRDAPGPGTRFLQRLAQEGRADLARNVGCEEVRHTIRTAATSLIVDQHPCESARGVWFFPLLIRRADVGVFQSTLAEMLTLKETGLSVLGPFAPYSFAGDA